jgi:hypothetical protein
MLRRPADFLQLGITSVELAPLLTPTFTLADWIYVDRAHPSAPAGA